jgi:C-terminal processing protease CtpA/Prc
MVGELNASHTGSRYRQRLEGVDQTAALGLLFDTRHRGAGLKVAEVVEEGPVDRAGEAVPPGSLLTNIDGTALTPRTNVAALLNRKAEKRVLLRFTTPAGKEVERVVKPIEPRAEFNLLYKRWVKQRREMTERLSNGRLGYVHVRGMNDRSFRHVFQEALGRHRAKEGLIVDTRFNGGGWLHDDLVQFLGGRRYVTFAPPRKPKGTFGGEPMHRWDRPVVVLQNEANYSDGHFFPYAFKQLGLGKLVGSPVAGTATAVWWERQVDGKTTYGIPQVGMVTPAGRYLENFELKPDVEIYNDPESVTAGRDKQLEKAVEVLLREVGR